MPTLSWRCRAASIAAVVMVMSQVSVASAQLPMLAGTSYVELVASAEGEGAAFPSAAVGSGRALRVFNDRRGVGSARKCAVAAGNGPVWSGEFVIGGEVTSGYYTAGLARKIWWAPLHPSNTMTLVVRGRRVESADSIRFMSAEVAWPTASPSTPPVSEAEREYFFPSGIAFPKNGTWIVVATTGNDWGCFVLSLF